MKNSLVSKLFLFSFFFSAETLVARVFFGESIRDAIVTLIKNEKRCIKVAMYTLTDPVVAIALIKARDRGVRIECVVDGYTNFVRSGKGYFLRKNGIMAMEYVKSDRTDLMHNKYFIFDRTKLYKAQSRSACVMTGSYNCTYNATFRNFENSVILSDQKTIDKFHRNFCKIKKESNVIPLSVAKKRSDD